MSNDEHTTSIRNASPFVIIDIFKMLLILTDITALPLKVGIEKKLVLDK